MRIFLAVLCACMLTGCATGRTYRPLSEGEKHKLAWGALGHCADVVTTQIITDDPDVVEGNPFIEAVVFDHEVEYMAVKTGVQLLTYLAVHATDDPAIRNRILNSNIVAAWGPTLWNVGIEVRF